MMLYSLGPHSKLLSSTAMVPPSTSPYVVLLPEQRTTHRQSLIRQLKERGIETTIGTWHMPMTTYFRQRYGYKTGDFPVMTGSSRVQ